ncbi:GNAT family N-acetyltransferase [Roseomonas eburnea]|uniref:GNAT family N-acetyltransferase n=1 Tax=Neoroseomonas eburnea TaxID=1346889 RepID=A0A9X9XE25_9PROT|nr:GNAT family N-acetyltransferase [Neoroseomonas eburnea]MBR0681961.1 GNAT family N-acetyltransferase [Neoroseomonas eburnea]
MATVRFRVAEAEDAVAVAALLTASWQESYAGLLPAPLLRDRLPALHAAMWRDHFAAPRPGIVLLAEGEDGLRGFCAAWLEGTEAYVDNLHLRPGLRGGGTGPQLLGRAVAALMARGATRAALTIIEGNDGALRFYHRLGGMAGQPYDAELHGERVRYRPITWARADELVRACGAGG